MLQMVWALIDAIWAILIQASATTVGPLHASYIGLGTAIVDNGVNTILANITEATFTGYARAAMAPFGPAYRTLAPAAGYDSSLVDFQPSDAITPNLITVIFIADASTAGNLQAYYVLPNPVPLTDATKHLPAVISLLMQAATSLGQVETW